MKDLAVFSIGVLIGSFLTKKVAENHELKKSLIIERNRNKSQPTG